MLNRSSKISGRPYARLTFKGSVNPTLNLDAVRSDLIAALKSSPHFVLVGDPTRSVSSAFTSGTTLGFGTVFFDADVRYNANADGLTFDVTLRAFDCAVRDAFKSCILSLSNAVLIGSTYSSASPLGTKSAQELAAETKSPLGTLTGAVGDPLKEASGTVRWIAAAAIVVGGVYLVKQGKPILRGIGRTFRRVKR